MPHNKWGESADPGDYFPLEPADVDLDRQVLVKDSGKHVPPPNPETASILNEEDDLAVIEQLLDDVLDS